MTESKHFPELNMETLEKRARKWAEIYPCIEQIDLYRPGYDFEENDDDYQPKYMFVVTVSSKIGIGIKDFSSHESSLDHESTFDIKGSVKFECKTISGNPFSKARQYLDSYSTAAAKKYPELESILRYYDWVQNDGMRGDCDHIGKYIPDFYNVRPKYSKIRDHWIWFSIPPQENIHEFNESDDDFVKVGEKEVLFKTKITPRKKKKREILQIAEEIWESHPDLLIKNMINLERIQQVNETTPGKPYSESTLRKFLSENAPQVVKKNERPPEETRRRQAEICKKLNNSF